MNIFTGWLDLLAQIGKRVGPDQREQYIPADPLAT